MGDAIFKMYTQHTFCVSHHAMRSFLDHRTHIRGYGVLYDRKVLSCQFKLVQQEKDFFFKIYSGQLFLVVLYPSTPGKLTAVCIMYNHGSKLQLSRSTTERMLHPETTRSYW